MLKRKLLIVFWVLCMSNPGCMISGCASLQGNPRAEYTASLRVFTATVDSLTKLQQAGKFDESETARLLVIIEQAQEYFNQWEPAAKAGKARPDIAGAVSKVIDELLAIELAKGGD